MSAGTTCPARPGLSVNRSGLADILGVSLPTVDSYLKRGMPFVARGCKGQEWAFNTRDVIDWLRAQDVEQAVADRPASPDIEAARLRKTMAEAELAELELAKQRGQYFSRDVIDRLVVGAFTIVRTTLVNFPAKLASRVPSPELAREVFKIAGDEIDAMLDQLSSTPVPGAEAARGEAA